MSPREGRAGVPDTTSRPMVGPRAPPTMGANRRTRREVPLSEATKRSGTGTSESESPVVPRKPANEDPKELVEGRGGQAKGTEGENDDRAAELGDHLHTNPTDS